MPGTQYTAPILPPWATDATVDQAVNMIVHEVHSHHELINHRVMVGARVMVAEAEALLLHEAEGWATQDELAKAATRLRVRRVWREGVSQWQRGSLTGVTVR